MVYSTEYGAVNAFESASFGGGRIVGTNNGTNSEVHYFLTDHLGSTRVVAKVTPTGREDLDRKDYYPFGKAWEQPDMPASDNRYMFSGKEWSDICLENDYSSILPIYDFGARSYYPEGVFFLQQDPLMEKYYSIGQYNYCAGNPIKHVDPNGMLIDDYFNHNGQYLGTDNASTDFVQIIGQDNWDANATNGIIDHDTGNNLSTNITEISLSDEAVTNIVEHYNDQLNTSEGNLDVKIKANPIEESPVMQYETEKGFNIGPISVTTRKAVVRFSQKSSTPNEPRKTRIKMHYLVSMYLWFKKKSLQMFNLQGFTSFTIALSRRERLHNL